MLPATHLNESPIYKQGYNAFDYRKIMFDYCVYEVNSFNYYLFSSGWSDAAKKYYDKIWFQI